VDTIRKEIELGQDDRSSLAKERMTVLQEAEKKRAGSRWETDKHSPASHLTRKRHP